MTRIQEIRLEVCSYQVHYYFSVSQMESTASGLAAYGTGQMCAGLCLLKVLTKELRTDGILYLSQNLLDWKIL